MDSFNDILKAVLEYCNNKVHPTAYELWFKPIRFKEFDNGTVTLAFPSSMKRDVVISQYNDLISEAFENVMGFKVEIKYTCDIIGSSPIEENSEENSTPVIFEKKDLEEYKNNRYTFDNFIVGPSNRFPYAAAKAVAADPGGQIKGTNTLKNYNPLFIYGNSGLGKTHILNAIYNEIEKSYPQLKIMYVKTEDFTNEFIASLQRKTVDEFNDKYRNNIDVFLVDDIQSLGNKEQTIEQFFHVFSALKDKGKQIVLTSDRLPKDISMITDRLKTRFEDGLLADIQPPEFETRCAIITRYAQINNFEIPPAVVKYIAEHIKTNIRHLEGVTNKLCAMQEIGNQQPTIGLVQTIIKDIIEEQQPIPVTIQRIVEEVSRTTGVSVDDIQSKAQKANISHARKITFYIIKKVTGLSHEKIGEKFNKHYSTVIYNINEIEKEMARDSKLARQINDIINNVKIYH